MTNCKHPDHHKSKMDCFHCGDIICPECARYAFYEHWPDGFCERLVCNTHFTIATTKGLSQKEKEKFWEWWT